jgi:hypothetical protein
MSEQPPASFTNEQKAYLSRVLKNMELKLNDIIAVARAIAAPGAIKQANLGPDIASNGPLVIANAALTTLAASTFTKINWTEEVVTHNCFASNRFTPNVAGYYQVNASVFFNSTAGANYLMLFKNGTGTGSAVGRYQDGSSGAVSTVGAQMCLVSAIVPMNGTTDYIEIFAFSGVANQINTGTNRFSSTLVRAA